MGTITQDNYKTLVAVATAYGHKLIAESPVDINIAKQVNVLALDAGFPLENLVIYPSTGALGYGMEYVYFIMERTRLVGLSGDKFEAQPILCDVGREAWAVKEARAPRDEQPAWGEEELRGTLVGGDRGVHVSFFWRGYRSPAPFRDRASGEKDCSRAHGGGKMILIGKRINGGFKDIGQAIREKAKEPIQS